MLESKGYVAFSGRTENSKLGRDVEGSGRAEFGDIVVVFAFRDWGER
jgi:hypothetical protein